MPHATYYQRRGKRLLDLLLAIPLCIALLPVMAAIAVLIRVKLGGPVLFRQQRPGLGASPFRMFKFRTMTETRDALGELLPDEQRLTLFGRWLRSTSLDELPELWHVVRGEMSLIGPRPLLMSYLDHYSAVEARRHEVRPGITGWAQVNGRNTLDWNARLALDVWYVEHVSLRLDLWILLKTVVEVARRSGVSQPGQATVLPLRPHQERLEQNLKKGVIVIGAGGHAKVVIATLQAAGLTVAGVLDDDASQWDRTVLGIPVVGPVCTLRELEGPRAVIAIGNNAVRRRIAREFDAEWVSVVHPRACVHETVELGAGTVVFAGAVIQPDVTIGTHCIVNTGASVDHDCRLGDFVHIAPGARLAGDVRVGSDTLIGVGACVTPGVCIGETSTIGAGSVVVRDLDDHVVAFGSPARAMSKGAGRKAA